MVMGASCTTEDERRMARVLELGASDEELSPVELCC